MELNIVSHCLKRSRSYVVLSGCQRFFTQSQYSQFLEDYDAYVKVSLFFGIFFKIDFKSSSNWTRHLGVFKDGVLLFEFQK